MFALNHRLREQVTPARRGRRKTEAAGDPPPARHVSMTWAPRLKRAFKIDILTCADGGAAAIRAAVKKSPLLNKRIQFNSLAPTAGVGLLGAGLFADDESNALR